MVPIEMKHNGHYCQKCRDYQRSEKQLHKIGVHPMFGFITAMPIPGVSTTFLATFTFEIDPTRDCPTEIYRIKKKKTLQEFCSDKWIHSFSYYSRTWQ